MTFPIKLASCAGDFWKGHGELGYRRNVFIIECSKMNIECSQIAKKMT